MQSKHSHVNCTAFSSPYSADYWNNQTFHNNNFACTRYHNEHVTSFTPPFILIFHTTFTAPSNSSLLPAVVSLGVVILFLIICVALLALPLAVTVTKLNKLKAEKAHTDPLHCYNKTAVEDGKGRLRIGSKMKWGKGQILLENKRGTTRSWNWRQWRRDSMRPCMEDTSARA